MAFWDGVYSLHAEAPAALGQKRLDPFTLGGSSYALPSPQKGESWWVSPEEQPVNCETEAVTGRRGPPTFPFAANAAPADGPLLRGVLGAG